MESPIIITVVIAIAFFVGFFALIVYLMKWGIKKRNKSFEDLARGLNLEYVAPMQEKWWKESFPSLEGMLLDRHVTLGMFSRGSGKNRYYVYYLSMACGVGRQKFSISREGFFNKIGKFFGGEDIQLNDEEFDKKFLIKGSEEIFVKRLLDNNIKRILVENRPKMKGRVELRPNEVYYEEIFNQNYKTLHASSKAMMYVMQKIAERAEYIETGD